MAALHRLIEYKNSLMSHNQEEIRRSLRLNVMNRALTAFALLLPLSLPVPAQKFQAASIRPNVMNDNVVDISVGPGNRFSTRGYSVKLLIQRAWNLKGFQILGGPEWINDARFDISAISADSETLTEEKLRPMLRTLLKERFHLRVREGRQDISGLAITVSRSGQKLTAEAADPALDEHRIRLTDISTTGLNLTIPQLAVVLGSHLGLPVQDRSGLTGTWRLHMNLSPVMMDEIHAAARAADIDSLPAFNEALQNTLGLRLIPAKVPSSVLWIDGIDRPTDN